MHGDVCVCAFLSAHPVYVVLPVHVIYIDKSECVRVCLFVCSLNILTSVLSGGEYDTDWDHDVGDDHYVDNIHVTWCPSCRRRPSHPPRPSITYRRSK